MEKFNLSKYSSKSPSLETLKEHRTTLTEEEKKEVMSSGAVWHHGQNGEESPGVWKSVVSGKTWYVCNTHRAYQCKPTLSEAIKAFEFIETTSSDDSLKKEASRKRIKDRGIDWKEHYHEKSQSLKKRFDRDIGPLSYMRWEGHDYTTNSDYFVVVGPAVTKELKKRFFAGIKKLPDDPQAKIYAPSGEYFTEIISAYGHANEKWGIIIPQGVPNYSVDTLSKVKIPRHVKG